MFEWAGALVGSLLFTAKNHQYATFGTELDDQVRTLVGHPDVIVLVDLNGMCIAPRIQMMSDLSNIIPVRVELEQLSRGCAIGWSRGAAPREDEDMSFRIDRNTCDFPEVHVRWKLEEIRLCVELDFGGRLLGNHRQRYAKNDRQHAALQCCPPGCGRELFLRSCLDARASLNRTCAGMILCSTSKFAGLPSRVEFEAESVPGLLHHGSTRDAASSCRPMGKRSAAVRIGYLLGKDPIAERCSLRRRPEGRPPRCCSRSAAARNR